MFTSKKTQRLAIFTFLSLLTISAFMIRLDNFKNSRARSIDEAVYFHMGEQMSENFFDYNTIPYGQRLATQKKSLPSYFFKPLFKHPPVYSFLVSLSIKLFGDSMLASVCIPLFISVLMIPMIYLAGALISGPFVGLLSAVILWLDPVHILSSQKIWMDSTIAFFTLLSSLFFIYGLKKNKDWAFIGSGLAASLAVNTKYTGILITGSIFLFALLYQQTLFTNKKFRLSLLLPFLMLIPWLIWNYAVLGADEFLPYQELNNIGRKFQKYKLVLFSIPIMTALFFIIKKKSYSKINATKHSPYKYLKHINFVIITIFFALLNENIFRGLNPFHIPKHSWSMGIFHSEPPTFYFGRLIEYSFIYIFGLIYMLKYHTNENYSLAFLRLSSLIFLLFFSAWGAYQSRYILSMVPFLIILSTHFWYKCLNYCSSNETSKWKNIGRLGLKTILIFTLYRMGYLAYTFSFPNDMCYF